MEAPKCANGHRPVYAQRYRNEPWININGERLPQFRCPVCYMKLFHRRPVQRRQPQRRFRFW